MTWYQILISILSLANVWLIWVLNQAKLAQAKHQADHEKITERLVQLERISLAEDRMRSIIREELALFELRLVNENRIPTKTKRV